MRTCLRIDTPCVSTGTQKRRQCFTLSLPPHSRKSLPPTLYSDGYDIGAGARIRVELSRGSGGGGFNGGESPYEKLGLMGTIHHRPLHPTRPLHDNHDPTGPPQAAAGATAAGATAVAVVGAGMAALPAAAGVGVTAGAGAGMTATAAGGTAMAARLPVGGAMVGVEGGMTGAARRCAVGAGAVGGGRGAGGCGRSSRCVGLCVVGGWGDRSTPFAPLLISMHTTVMARTHTHTDASSNR